MTVYENKNEFLELESIFIINQYLEIKDKLSEKLSPIDFDNYLFDGGRNEYDYKKKSPEEIRKIEDLIQLLEINSKMYGSLPEEGGFYVEDMLETSWNEMNKLDFLESQIDLREFY